MTTPGTVLGAPDARARAHLLKLRAHLAPLPRPRKLAKYLTRLSALPPGAPLLADHSLAESLRRLRDYGHLAGLAADLLQRLMAHAPPGSQGPGGTKRSTRSRDSPRQPGEACGPNSGATEPSRDGNRKVPPLRIPLTRMTPGDARPASPDTPPQAPAHNDDVQRAALSFQECLDYDLPPRKRPKKKKEPSKATSTQTSRGCPAEDHREQPQDENCIPLEEAIALLAGPSAPWPEAQAEDTPAPACLMPWEQPPAPSPQEAHVAPSRVHSRTPVFAGSRRAPAPKHPSPRPLCTPMTEVSPKVILFGVPTARPPRLPGRPQGFPAQAVHHSPQAQHGPESDHGTTKPSGQAGAQRSLPPSQNTTLCCPPPSAAPCKQGLIESKSKPKKPKAPLMAKSLRDFRGLYSRRC